MRATNKTLGTRGCRVTQCSVVLSGPSSVLSSVPLVLLPAVICMFSWGEVLLKIFSPWGSLYRLTICLAEHKVHAETETMSNKKFNLFLHQ